jgi:uncharacterized protein YjbJ (UPF0337 family)
MRLKEPNHWHQKHATMDKLTVKGNWNQVKGRLKATYGQLTDDDLLLESGKEEEMYGRLQKKLGKSREEIKKMIEDL